MRDSTASKCFCGVECEKRNLSLIYLRTSTWPASADARLVDGDAVVGHQRPRVDVRRLQHCLLRRRQIRHPVWNTAGSLRTFCGSQQEAARQRGVYLAARSRRFRRRSGGTCCASIEGQPALFLDGCISPIFAHFSAIFSRFLRLDARNPESGARRPGAGCVTVQNGRQKSGRRRSLEE